MTRLQTYLLTNAIFSGFSGVVLVAFSTRTAAIFGVPDNQSFVIIGFGLLLFSASVFLETVKQRAMAVLWIIVQDMIWVVGSISILVLKPFSITNSGEWIIAVVAFVVLLMGVLQATALSKVDGIGDGKKRLSYKKPFQADRSTVWAVIADIGNYHLVAPNIDDVKIVSGAGKGLVRNCAQGGKHWTETCTLWEEGHQYAFEVNTAAPDYPFPLNQLKGTWKLEAMEQGTLVDMSFDFRYRQAWQNLLLHPLMRWKFSSIVAELFENWEKQIYAAQMAELRAS